MNPTQLGCCLWLNWGRTSIRGRTDCISRLCTEGNGSGGIHTSRPSIMCSWAARSRLKRPLGLGASSTSTCDSGLDAVAAGSLDCILFSFCLASSRCLLWSFCISDFSFSQFASFSRPLCSCSYSTLSMLRSLQA